MEGGGKCSILLIESSLNTSHILRAMSGCVGLVMGAVVPLVFRRLGIDPAVASGPLITTLNNGLSLLLYFGIAVFFFRARVMVAYSEHGVLSPSTRDCEQIVPSKPVEEPLSPDHNSVSPPRAPARLGVFRGVYRIRGLWQLSEGHRRLD